MAVFSLIDPLLESGGQRIMTEPQASNGAHENITADALDVNEVAREIRQAAEQARLSMVKTLNDSALTLRKQTRAAGADAEVIKAVDEVAHGFEKAAVYLHGHNVDEIRKDAQKTVEENSTWIIIAVLIVGVILGLLLRGGNDKK